MSPGGHQHAAATQHALACVQRAFRRSRTYPAAGLCLRSGSNARVPYPVDDQSVYPQLRWLLQPDFFTAMKSSTAAEKIAGGSGAGSLRDTIEQRLVRLLHENHAALDRLAGSYAASPSDRADLLQEIAFALWRALPTFRGECSERTFLFRIAHNRCMAHLARRRNVAPLGEEELELPDPGPHPEVLVGREQETHRLVEAIRRLPVSYRQVIVLTLEGLDYREIAQVLGIGESNVGVRLTRARLMLKKSLGGT
jgi:RNA polymerase sigma factor (sigma-70 family)